MKFTLSRSALQEGLAAVDPAVAKRDTNVVLKNVLLEAEGSTLRLTGSDGGLTIRVDVEADVEVAGSLSLPGKKLAEWVKRLDKGDICVEVEGEIAEIRSGRANAKLVGLAAEEYPSPRKVDFSQSITVQGDALREMIARVTFAASEQETRPVLCGALWQFRGDKMRMVATDGYRFSMLDVPTTAVTGGVLPDIIVPKSTLEVLKRLFSADDSVEVSATENQVFFRKEGVLVISALVSGPYPNYDVILPKDHNRTLVVDREALLQAVRRMAVMATDNTKKLRLSLGAQTTLSVPHTDTGEAKEELDGFEYEGEPLDIGFNAEYLSDVVAVLPTPMVRLTFKSEERAALLSPVAADGEEVLDLTTLVMPLRLDA